MLKNPLSKMDVYGVCWHPVKPLLLCVLTVREWVGNTRAFRCVTINYEKEERDIVGLTTFRVPVPHGACTAATFVALQHHPSEDLALLLYRTVAIVFDPSSQDLRSVADLKATGLPPLVNGGWYPDGERFWSFHREGAGAGLWVEWNWKTGERKTTSLQNRAFPFHQATLHPGGELIAACWEGNDSGVHLLKKEGEEFVLYATPAIQRSDAKLFCPTFSPDGRFLALLANPDIPGKANFAHVCIYDLLSGEQEQEFSTQGSVVAAGVQFTQGGQSFAVVENNTSGGRAQISIHRIDSRSEWEQTRYEADVKTYAVHSLLPLRALSFAPYMDIARFSADTDTAEGRAPEIAREFVSRHQGTAVRLAELAPRSVPGHPIPRGPGGDAFTTGLSHIFGLAWHPASPHLLCVRENPPPSASGPRILQRLRHLTIQEKPASDPAFTLSLFEPQGKTWTHTDCECEAIPGYGKFVQIRLHPEHNQVLLIQEHGARIFDYANRREIARQAFSRALFDGGWYPDEDRVWLLQETVDEENGDWTIWDYAGNVCRSLALLRPGFSASKKYYRLGPHDNGEATLHPGGTLIAGCWQKFGVGYDLYQEEEADRAGCYTEPAGEVTGDTVYMPVFSPEGDRIAFISQSYSMFEAIIGQVNIFPLRGGDPVTFSTESGEHQEIGLSFLNGGQEIALANAHWVRLHDVTTGKEKYLEDAAYAIKAFQGHPLFPYYAYANSDALTIRRYRTDPQSDPATTSFAQVQAAARRNVEEFLWDNAAHFRPLEIPKEPPNEEAD